MSNNNNKNNNNNNKPEDQEPVPGKDPTEESSVDSPIFTADPPLGQSESPTSSPSSSTSNAAAATSNVPVQDPARASHSLNVVPTPSAAADPNVASGSVPETATESEAAVGPGATEKNANDPSKTPSKMPPKNPSQTPTQAPNQLVQVKIEPGTEEEEQEVIFMGSQPISRKEVAKLGLRWSKRKRNPPPNMADEDAYYPSPDPSDVSLSAYIDSSPDSVRRDAYGKPRAKKLPRKSLVFDENPKNKTAGTGSKANTPAKETKTNQKGQGKGGK